MGGGGGGGGGRTQSENPPMQVSQTNILQTVLDFTLFNYSCTIMDFELYILLYQSTNCVRSHPL